MILSAKQAIARHIQWKIMLQFAVRMREPLTPEIVFQIEHVNDCAIGRWLISSATREVRQRPEFTALVDRHNEFHREMHRVSLLIARGAWEEAGAALDAHSPYDAASTAIAQAITAFDRVLTVCAPL